jgi:hypothetical protein
MANKPKQVQLLDKEINRLKRRARQLEQQIDGRLDYFQDNLGSLAIKSVLPGFLARSGIIGTLLNLVIGSRGIQKSTNKVSGFLFDKILAAFHLVRKKLSRKSR